MHGLALTLLTLTLSAEPVGLLCDGGDDYTDQGRDGRVVIEAFDLTDGVVACPSRRFKMPVTTTDPEGKIDSLRMFVSPDSGKTWMLVKNFKPTDKEVFFHAPRDGMYWFALQVVYKDGKHEPESLNHLVAQQKVYVDTEHKVLKPR
jgi:hypothetical protein